VRLREVILVLQEEVDLSEGDRSWLMSVMDSTVAFSPTRIQKHSVQVQRRGSNIGVLPSSVLKGEGGGGARRGFNLLKRRRIPMIALA